MYAEDTVKSWLIEHPGADVHVKLVILSSSGLTYNNTGVLMGLKRRPDPVTY